MRVKDDSQDTYSNCKDAEIKNKKKCKRFYVMVFVINFSLSLSLPHDNGHGGGTDRQT